jgi:hypothetical protein
MTSSAPRTPAMLNWSTITSPSSSVTRWERTVNTATPVSCNSPKRSGSARRRSYCSLCCSQECTVRSWFVPKSLKRHLHSELLSSLTCSPEGTSTPNPWAWRLKLCLRIRWRSWLDWAPKMWTTNCTWIHFLKSTCFKHWHNFKTGTNQCHHKMKMLSKLSLYCYILYGLYCNQKRNNNYNM